jgi:hypothetical protein
MKRLILVVDVFTEATALVASMAATPPSLSKKEKKYDWERTN